MKGGQVLHSQWVFFVKRKIEEGCNGTISCVSLFFFFPYLQNAVRKLLIFISVSPYFEEFF